MRLENKVALVTSCRSSICGQTAQRLSEAGAKVMICGRNTAKGLEIVRRIQQRGGRAAFVLADIAIPCDVEAVIDETIATYGRLDILLNHVSAEHAQDSEIAEVSEVIWDRIVESALKGTFLCCQYALPFLQQSSGTIINLIRQPSNMRFNAVTTICQGGVAAMTSAITQDYSVRPVTANLLWIKPLSEPKFNIEPASSKQISLSKLSPSAAEDERSNLETPILSAIVPPFTDVATAVLYLASRSSTIQGSTLVVSEGN